MNVEITYLKNHPEHVGLMAKWTFETWGHYNPTLSVEKAKIKIQSHLNDSKLPLTYVALIDNKPVGMCSLRENDGIRPDLTPWLGSLFVAPFYRNQGIGEQLIEVIVKKSRDLGFLKLYLLAFDKTLPDWYMKLGWKQIGMDDVNGFAVNVMEKEL